MDLLKYLEPMKNLPDRFSNLAFWRGVRKLRDEVVNAFEYVDSWGESIESEVANSGLKFISSTELTTNNTNLLTRFLFKDSTTNVSFFNIDVVLTNDITAPVNAKYAFIFLECDISDLPNNTDFIVSNFVALNPTFHKRYPIGVVPFQSLTSQPHISTLRNAFIFFYG